MARPFRFWISRLAGVLALLALVAALPAQAATKIVVFPFDLIDDTKEDPLADTPPEELSRLKLVADELRKLLAADSRYEVVDIAPIAAEIVEKAPIYKCNGCEDGLARKVGAELAVIATVQKVSNAALNVSVFLRDVAKEKILRSMTSDIRGNTDESWLRGVKHLTKNQLLAEDPKR